MSRSPASVNTGPGGPLAGSVDIRTVPKVSLISLGCPKNLVDSEVLLGHLLEGGFYLCEDPKDSDIVLVNTCSFLEASRAESMEAIRGALKLKRDGRVKGVVVAGCLPQKYREDLLRDVPDADALLGVTRREEVVDICRRILGRNGGGAGTDDQVVRTPLQCETDRTRLRLTPRHYAYVRVMEGCNHPCAFCLIPQIRGRFRSKPVGELVLEAERLAKDGVREINLIAQDSTSYGEDLYGGPSLAKALRALSGVDGVEWIRILYAYPARVTDDLIDEIAGNPKVVKYLDMPIQHVSDRMLTAMRRQISGPDQAALLRRIRARVPGIALRTTLIAGFPGETDADVDETIGFLREFRFERLGCFAYSREPGTQADRMEGHLPADVIGERRDRIMTAQQKILFDVYRTWVGREVPAIVDRPLGKDRWEARTWADAPEVDAALILNGRDLAPGSIVTARIEGYKGYDLAGRVVETAASPV